MEKLVGAQNCPTCGEPHWTFYLENDKIVCPSCKAPATNGGN